MASALRVVPSLSVMVPRPGSMAVTAELAWRCTWSPASSAIRSVMMRSANSTPPRLVRMA
jgi:hypothetical protein